jgi:hypothetical protein
VFTRSSEFSVDALASFFGFAAKIGLVVETVLEIVDLSVQAGVGQLIGLIKNIGIGDIYGLGFTFNFHDASGAIVETRYGSALLYTIPVGEYNVFEVFFPANIPASAEAVSIETEWQEGRPAAVYARQGLNVSGLQAHVDGSSYIVSGMVENVTGRRASRVTLLGVAFNSSGRLNGETLTVVDDLAAGDAASFALPFSLERMPDPVDRYDVLVEAQLEG